MAEPGNETKTKQLPWDGKTKSWDSFKTMKVAEWSKQTKYRKKWRKVFEEFSKSENLFRVYSYWSQKLFIKNKYIKRGKRKLPCRYAWVRVCVW